MDTVNKRHVTSYNTWVVLFATLGSITYGYCTSIIATTLGQPTFLHYFNLDSSGNAAAITGGLNGLYQAGGLFGSLSSAWAADKVGRRKAIGAAAMTCILGGALQAGSAHVAMFMIARFITGFGTGALVTLVPMWQSEVSSPATRGFLVGMHGVFILVGYSLASWVGVGFFFVNAGGAQWRIPLAIQTIPPFLLACGIMRLPESPRWLISRGIMDEAMEILGKLHGRPTTDGEENYAALEFKQIQDQLSLDAVLPCSWASLFTVPSYRRRAVVGFLVMFCAQCTGTQVINNYGPSLYASIGFGSRDQLLLQAGWISVGIIGNFVNALLLDHAGRKYVMVTGLGGTAVALLGEAVMLALYQGSGNAAGISAAVFFLFLHIVFYASCLDASTYVYASEIWPTHIRSKGTAFSTSGLFLSSLILLTVSPTAFDAIGWRYYLVLMSFTVLSIFVFALLFPETKGLALEEVGRLFKDAVVEIQGVEADGQYSALAGKLEQDKSSA
ncbi:hypothetical protein G7Z17_g7062 [Neofusicoccum parvum]|nr:hypothetical protein G7Z17_g7062 [Neofusicoccum parvum]